jgi:hypothetical protein
MLHPNTKNTGVRFGMTLPLSKHLPSGYPGIPSRLQAKRYPRLPIADRTALFRNPDGSGGHPEPGETFGMALNPRSFRGRIAERFLAGLKEEAGADLTTAVDGVLGSGGQLPTGWSTTAHLEGVTLSVQKGDGYIDVTATGAATEGWRIKVSSSISTSEGNWHQSQIDAEVVAGNANIANHNIVWFNSAHQYISAAPRAINPANRDQFRVIGRAPANAGVFNTEFLFGIVSDFTIRFYSVSAKRLPDAPWVAPSTEAALTLQQHPAGGVRNLVRRTENPLANQHGVEVIGGLSIQTGLADPFGGTRAFKYTEDSSNSNHTIRWSPQVDASGRHTASVIVKADGRGVFTMLCRDNGQNAHRSAIFDLYAGVVIAGSQGLSGAEEIEDLGDGWFLCTVSFDVVSHLTYFDLRFSDKANTTGVSSLGDGYLGDGVSGCIIVNPQVEAGDRSNFQRVYNQFWVEEDGQQPVFSGVSDGTDDTSGLAVDGTGEANSTAFLMMRTTDASGVLMHHSDGWWRGIWLAGSSTPLDAPHGDPSIWVNGIPFGPTNTRGDVANTLADGEWKFVKLPILNMMSSPGTIYLNGFTGSNNYEWLGEIADLRIVPDSELTPALEQAIEDDMRYQVGQNPAYVEPWDIDGLMLYPDVSHESAVLSGLDGSGGPAEHGSTYGMIVDRADLKNQTFDEYVAGLPELAGADFSTAIDGIIGSGGALPSGWHLTSHGTTVTVQKGDGYLDLIINGTNTSNDQLRWVNQGLVSPGNLVMNEMTVTNPSGTVTSRGILSRFLAFSTSGGSYLSGNFPDVPNPYDNGQPTHSVSMVAPDTAGKFNAGLFWAIGTYTDYVIRIHSVSTKRVPATIWTAPSTEGSPTLAREVPGVRRNLVENNVTQAPINPNAPFVFATSGRPDPKGGNQAIRLQSDVSEGRTLFRFPLIEKPSTNVAVTIQIKKNVEPIPDGTPGLGSDISDGVGYSYLNNGVADAAVGEWVEFKYEAVPGAGGLGWLDIALTSADWDIDVYLPQVEYGIHTTVQAVAGQFDSSEDGQRSLVYSVFDGIDDTIQTRFPGGSGPVNGSVFCLLDRQDIDNGGLFSRVNGGGFFGAMDGSSVTDHFNGAGAITTFVEGVQLPDERRVTLRDALGTNRKRLVEFQNVDLSSWPDIMMADIFSAPYELNAKVLAILVYKRVLTGMDRINVYRHLNQLIGE